MGIGDRLLDTLGNLNDAAGGRGQTPDVVAMHPEMPVGYKTRELLSWRVPGVGFIQMYINPQSIVIQEKKIINRQRTKGGYIVQYWGEEPAEIKISGSTGASGVEGINVLRNAYRSEQNAYKSIAQKLTQSVEKSMEQKTVTLPGSNSDVGDTAFLPTLGSLSLSVEMYYQGITYIGYFQDFLVTESVSNGVGVFMYDMTFVSMDRRGERKNFMPWHRNPAQVTSNSEQPIGYNVADSKNTPFSYKGQYNK